jgi:hypothetical protein
MRYNRELIIDGMCFTMRHDYGLEKTPSDGAFSFSSGMTQEERNFLRNQMAQIYDNVIEPNMMFRHPYNPELCDND